MDELNRKTVQEFKVAEKTPLIVVLDNVRSMNNVGSIFRTSDAFLIEKIILGGITPTPPHREIQKTALGATESVNWEHQPDLLQYLNTLNKDEFIIVSCEQADKSTFLQHLTIETSKKIVLILGNEVDGVSEEIINISDFVVEIPQFGLKHSLNVAVSAGIIIWQIVQKLRLKP